MPNSTVGHFKVTEETMNSTFKDKLKALYPFRVEMHAHTLPVSPCSEVTPEELIEIYSKRDYDAVVLTNHFTTSLFSGMTKEEAVNYYYKDFEDLIKAGIKHNIMVYLGIEIRFEKESYNDFLIYGVDKSVIERAYDYLDTDLRTFRNEVKLDNSVLLQAHPYRTDNIADSSLLDGIEMLNMHPGHNSRIGLAIKDAVRNDHRILTAGSDFHHPNLEHDGNAALRFRNLPKDSFEIAEILKSGDYVIDLAGEVIVLP